MFNTVLVTCLRCGVLRCGEALRKEQYGKKHNFKKSYQFHHAYVVVVSGSGWYRLLLMHSIFVFISADGVLWVWVCWRRWNILKSILILKVAVAYRSLVHLTITLLCSKSQQTIWSFIQFSFIPFVHSSHLISTHFVRIISIVSIVMKTLNLHFRNL